MSKSPGPCGGRGLSEPEPLGALVDGQKCTLSRHLLARVLGQVQLVEAAR